MSILLEYRTTVSKQVLVDTNTVTVAIKMTGEPYTVALPVASTIHNYKDTNTL
jgi:hypothetical protein